MIKDAISYIVSLGRNQSEIQDKEINGHIYCKDSLIEVHPNMHYADALRLTTLRSVASYLESMSKEFENVQNMILHVESERRVTLLTQLDDYRMRECTVYAEPVIPKINFDEYMNQEEFIVMVQSCFTDNIDTDKSLLLQVAGTVEKKSLKTYYDDGLAQQATVSDGVASKSDVILPNHIYLQPFRTFHEVVQPVEEFVFRMRENNVTGNPEFMLKEADGGAWKINCINEIHEYLTDAISSFDEQLKQKIHVI